MGELGKATRFSDERQPAIPGGVFKKGSKHTATWINELLNDESFVATIQQGLQVKEYKGAPIKAIIGAQIRLAINGDTKATDVLFKYSVPQKLLLGNDPDNPLTNVKQLTNEELNDRLREIVAERQTGSDSDTARTG